MHDLFDIDVLLIFMNNDYLRLFKGTLSFVVKVVFMCFKGILLFVSPIPLFRRPPFDKNTFRKDCLLKGRVCLITTVDYTVDVAFLNAFVIFIEALVKACLRPF